MAWKHKYLNYNFLFLLFVFIIILIFAGIVTFNPWLKVFFASYDKILKLSNNLPYLNHNNFAPKLTFLVLTWTSVGIYGLGLIAFGFFSFNHKYKKINILYWKPIYRQTLFGSILFLLIFATVLSGWVQYQYSWINHWGKSLNSVNNIKNVVNEVSASYNVSIRNAIITQLTNIFNGFNNNAVFMWLNFYYLVPFIEILIMMNIYFSFKIYNNTTVYDQDMVRSKDKIWHSNFKSKKTISFPHRSENIIKVMKYDAKKRLFILVSFISALCFIFGVVIIILFYIKTPFNKFWKYNFIYPSLFWDSTVNHWFNYFLALKNNSIYDYLLVASAIIVILTSIIVLVCKFYYFLFHKRYIAFKELEFYIIWFIINTALFACLFLAMNIKINQSINYWNTHVQLKNLIPDIFNRTSLPWFILSNIKSLILFGFEMITIILFTLWISHDLNQIKINLKKVIQSRIKD